MGILRVDSPDIMEFIRHKEDLTKLTNFNISVAVTDVFMAAVEAGTTYDLVNPRTQQVAGQLDAREVFKEIVQRAWSTGEPGVVFIDRMNEYCPVPWIGQYEATNPCGEQPLIPYESCNLGSINLERFVLPATSSTYHEPVGMEEGWLAVDGKLARVDWARLREVVHTATHLLDNVIDANKFPIPELKTMSDATRKIGLGVMGFARMLFKLGIAYGSDESVELASELMAFIDLESKKKSVELAKVRGSFPARKGHEAESNAIFVRWCKERADKARYDLERDDIADGYLELVDLIPFYGIRNSNTTTVAPTGTLSIIADTSGGCEPVFALAFKRWQADTHMVDSDSVFKDWLENRAQCEGDIKEIMEAVDGAHGSLIELLETWSKRLSSSWEDIKQPMLQDAAKIFVTAHDISPEQHVKIQAAFQAFNDSACSKTINFAESATPEDVETAYRLAYATGCKGITIYRNNSRQFQPLSVSEKPKAEEVVNTELDISQAQVELENEVFALGELVGTLLEGTLTDSETALAVKERLSKVVRDSGVLYKALKDQLEGGEPITFIDRSSEEDLAEARKVIGLPQRVQNMESCTKPVCKEPRKRSQRLPGFNERIQTPEGRLHVNVNYDDLGIREVFATLGRGGGVVSGFTEAIGRLISLALQHHVPVEDVIKQLEGIRGGDPVGFGPNKVHSVADGIAKVLKELPKQFGPYQTETMIYFPTGTYEMASPPDEDSDSETVRVPEAQPEKVSSVQTRERALALGASPECPDCGSGLDFGEGCITCRSCGYSKCS